MEIKELEEVSNIFEVIVKLREPSSLGSVDSIVRVSVPSHAIGVEVVVIPVSSDSSKVKETSLARQSSDLIDYSQSNQYYIETAELSTS